MASKSKVPPGLEQFTRLNHSVWYHEPTTSNPTTEPDLVLLVGWMDATARHLSRYAIGYQKLYPSTRTIIITTTQIDSAFRTQAANLNRVKPALEILYTIPQAKILVHFFSNGGAWTTNIIAKKYKEKMGHSLPATAMILDSCPGRATYEATVRAFSVALPKNIILRTLGILAFRIFFFLYKFAYFIQGKTDLIDVVRMDLNDKTLFDTDAPRMYIYSTADQMVDWRDVEEHAGDAKRLGYTVDQVNFLNTGHAAHLLGDQGRYWQTVQRLWRHVS